MPTSLQQWESDPLFAAAEVVQDSADRMESVFRLLLHEQSLAQGYQPESRVLHSIKYHKRDLATTLETAKWQLEDFEREVNLLAMADKSQVKQNVISRHKQFIEAISEQIKNVDKSLERTSAEDSVRNTEWGNLNEQDRDGLASFLSGGKPITHSGSQDSEDDRSVLRSFHDPAASSSITDEIVEEKTETLKMNGVSHLGSNIMRENKFSSLQVATSSTCDEHDWDLEANEAKDKTSFKWNKIRNHYGRMSGFKYLRDFIFAHKGWGNRSLTKRWKDGEEQRHFPRWGDISFAAQSHLGQLRLAGRCRNILFSLQELHAGIIRSWGLARNWIERQEVSLYSITIPCHSIALILGMLLIVIVLGTMASRVL